MNPVGRNLTDAVDGALNGKRYLTHDRDPLFTAEFHGGSRLMVFYYKSLDFIATGNL